MQQPEQLADYLRLIIRAMGRSPDGSRSRLFFKFQSSENIDAITNAFPEVPWVFLFREPVEVTSNFYASQVLYLKGSYT
jgi:hypothetical protein